MKLYTFAQVRKKYELTSMQIDPLIKAGHLKIVNGKLDCGTYFEDRYAEQMAKLPPPSPFDWDEEMSSRHKVDLKAPNNSVEYDNNFEWIVRAAKNRTGFIPLDELDSLLKEEELYALKTKNLIEKGKYIDRNRVQREYEQLSDRIRNEANRLIAEIPLKAEMKTSREIKEIVAAKVKKMIKVISTTADEVAKTSLYFEEVAKEKTSFRINRFMNTPKKNPERKPFQ